MKRVIWASAGVAAVLAAGILWLLDGRSHPAAAEPLPVFVTDDEANTIEVFRRAAPSVVSVTNTALIRRRFSSQLVEADRGYGSGFVWDAEQGIIVTNYHVVHRASRIIVTLASGSEYEAEKVGVAPEKDLAVLKIEAPAESLTELPTGNSSELTVGSKVLAIGNPFNFDSTLTVGVVSALGREIRSPSNRIIRDVIQTDAAINPGNSGGPLINSKGQLVGVNAAITSPVPGSSGIAFAIPVNTVSAIVPDLIRYGRLYRPVMGIEIVSPAFTRRYGIQGVPIFSVAKGGPADRAGMIGVREDRRGDIYLGDVIIAMEGDAILNQDQLLAKLEEYKPGDQVSVTACRNRDIRRYYRVVDTSCQDDEKQLFEVTLEAPPN